MKKKISRRERCNQISSLFMQKLLVTSANLPELLRIYYFLFKSTEHACADPPTPAHGNTSCTPQGDSSVECILSCNDGYDFAVQPAEKYSCDYETGAWTPEDNMPFPDCARECQVVTHKSLSVVLDLSKWPPLYVSQND